MDRHSDQPQSIRPGDPGIDEAWLRRHRNGAIATLLWLFGWIPVIGVGAMVKVGPFGWMATLEQDAIGTDSPFLTGLPLIVIWLGPGMVANMMRKDVSRPFLFGIQDALDARRKPVLVIGRRRDPKRYLRRTSRVSRTIAALCLVPIAIGAWKMAHVGSLPHVPLPVLDYGRVVSGGALPGRARVTDAIAHPDLSWTHNYSIRQTRYRDVYYPLTSDRWAAGQPVHLIELDPTFPDDDPAPYNEVNAPGPREGKLHRLDDSWTAAQLRSAGVPVADDAVVLEREQLGGFEPHADAVDDFFLFIFPAILVGLIALVMDWAARAKLRTYV
jgi:hypothetical protein